MNMRSLETPASRPVLAILAVLATVAAGCATSGYSPPSERRASERCPAGEVWVCEDRYPSRIESENAPEPICRCENPARIR
jgi:hypothetical protein